MDSDTQNANQENSEHTDSDTHDTNKVVDVEKLRQEFVENYKAKKYFTGNTSNHAQIQ